MLNCGSMSWLTSMVRPPPLATTEVNVKVPLVALAPVLQDDQRSAERTLRGGGSVARVRKYIARNPAQWKYTPYGRRKRRPYQRPNRLPASAIAFT